MNMEAVNLTEDLKQLLRKMWVLDEKIKFNLEITNSEIEFYNQHLLTMIGYYAQNTQYWSSRRELEVVDLAREMLNKKRG